MSFLLLPNTVKYTLFISKADNWIGIDRQESTGRYQQVVPVWSYLTHCVRRVKAALVMEVGRFRPLVISRHIFLLITSTKPPFRWQACRECRDPTPCLAMIGIRFTGVPAGAGEKSTISTINAINSSPLTSLSAAYKANQSSISKTSDSFPLHLAKISLFAISQRSALSVSALVKRKTCGFLFTNK